ncbi:MAG: proton-conducting transporter transmembrane domain-containing protein, partial [Thermoanaerobaculia bacterium]
MNQLWLIPLLPLAGFLVNGLVALVASSSRAEKEFGADQPGAPLPYAQRLFHGLVGVGSVGFAAVLSFAAVVPYVLGSMHNPEGLAPVVQRVYTWMAAGAYSVDVAFRLDALSALMLSFVTFVGTLIHLYSVGYMQKEEGYGRYFSYLNLFMFAMLTLVLADNLPLLFVGWEGVGLCSYLLIGYYWDKDFAADAGKKAFVVNRIGDFGFVLGIFGCFALFGTTDFGAMFSLAAADPGRYAAGGLLTAICVALFIGACGKSAQIPLYVWLPDAMAGPTPVSALIHAATMVTAGVYMVARCNLFFRISHAWAVESAHGHPTTGWLLTHDASFVVAVVGGATALFAATMGLAQTDIKKVLAYSTVSQLGYMFLGCGVLAFSAGMFHVFTHAWFKACLFLGSGSVIHALSGEQDMTKMGGLRKLVPHTFLTMFVATLAIAGVPGLAGFFSKDAILGETYAAGGLLTAVCLCLFVGACGKSAQIPLYVWLPDAMAGPTPVSALIHAAT